MFETRWPLQEQDSGDPQAGGGAPSKESYVETKLEERYKPREVRELLARFGDKAEVALENVVKEHNEMVKRLMKNAASLEFDLAAAQKAIETSKSETTTLQTAHDQLKAQLDGISAKERSANVEAALAKRFNDDKTLVTRHRAYLKLEGFDLDIEGDKLMVVNGEKRHNFDTVVNDAFYSRYEDAKPAGDTPLPSGGNPPKADKAASNIGEAAAALYAQERAAMQKTTTLPKGN